MFGINLKVILTSISIYMGIYAGSLIAEFIIYG